LARGLCRPFAGEVLPEAQLRRPCRILKNLDTFIYQKTTERDFSGFPNYNPALTPGCAPQQPDCDPNIGTLTTQDNGNGGKVYGFELSVSLDGSLISPKLDGIGLIASQSQTYNSLPKDENGNEIELDGFSGTVRSLEAYSRGAAFAAGSASATARRSRPPRAA
jgi:iron complex outermembrane receptor protein